MGRGEDAVPKSPQSQGKGLSVPAKTDPYANEPPSGNAGWFFYTHFSEVTAYSQHQTRPKRAGAAKADPDFSESRNGHYQRNRAAAVPGLSGLSRDSRPGTGPGHSAENGE